MDEKIFISISKDELAQTIKDSIKDVLSKEYANSKNFNEDENLLTIEDVQKIFRVSKVTIHKWKKRGLIRYHKLGRRLYFKKSELLDDLEKKKERKFKPYGSISQEIRY